MQRKMFVVASVLVSAIFLALTLHDIPLDAILSSLKETQPGWVFLAVTAVVVGQIPRAIRWRGLLGNQITIRDAFYIVNIMQFINQLPLRAGEVARTLLAQQRGVPVVTAAASIVIERLFDTCLVLIVLAVAISQAPVSSVVTSTATLFGVAIVVAFCALIFFARYPHFLRAIVTRVETLLPSLRRFKLARLVDDLLAGLGPLTHYASLFHVLVWTLISWVFSYGSFYLLTFSPDTQHVNRLLLTALSVSLASFSAAIPPSIASIGPFEGAVRVAGEAADLARTTATSLGFIFHFVNILSSVIVGVASLIAVGFSFTEVRALLVAKEVTTTTG